jgi:hypothetical protein
MTAHDDTAQQPGPVHITLPGFLLDTEVGLGTLLKRMTATVGVRPCGDCEERAAALNRLVVFTRSGS